MNFGPWVFDRESLTLTHQPNGYEIDLERITTSAQMLDWIMQITGKRWGDVKTVGALCKAFEHIFSPQMTMCGQGTERGPINPRIAIGNILVMNRQLGRFS